MTTAIRIPMPVLEDEDDEVDLVAYLVEQLGNEQEGYGELVSALDTDPGVDDSRISLAGIEIIAVDHDDKTIDIQYDVEFSAYYGCDDMDGSWIDEGRIAVGVKDGDSWVFQRYVPPERPAPNEEL